jgi:hydroxymethylpyrimidine/phosphomethylpyrimidine kinase
MAGRILTVAESDSCGASGIQADIKTILALGGYATTAIAAVTAQNTGGVEFLQPMDPCFVAQQMRLVLEDIGTDAIKIGILSSEGIVHAVADVLDEYQDKDIPVVTDPSILARNGERLMDENAITALKRRLYVRASVITPNLKEAEILTGLHIRDIDDMRHVADMMRTLGVETVVLKAGQAFSDKVVYLVARDEERIYERPMLDTRHTLGAGCTLSSAIAAGMAQKMDVFAAVERAPDFMHQAMLHAPGYGKDAGPMNHAFDIERHSAFFNPENVKVRKI